MGKVCFGLIAVFLILQSGCLTNTGSGATKTLAISSLEPSTMNVYPKGASDIKCVVTAPEGDSIQYKWSTDGGTLTGEGSIVRWQGPSDYGDYHVMVTASDNNGNSDGAVLTLSVVPRPVRSCCGRTF
jgi:FlaG/FlaF family flagellin (archaellin)